MSSIDSATDAPGSTAEVVTDRADPGHAAAVELGAVCLAVVAAAGVVAAGYWAGIRLPVVPWVVVSFVGVAAGSVAYARLRGFDVGIEPPARADLPVALATVAVPIAGVGLLTVVGGGLGVPLSRVTSTSYAPGTPFEVVVRRWTVPAIAAGLGYGVLTSALVHESVRRVVVSRTSHAVTVTAAIALFFRVLLVDGATTLVSFPAVRRVVLLLALAGGFVCLGVTAGFAYRSAIERSVEPLYRPAYVPVFALALVVAAGSLVVLADYPDVLGHALWALGLAAAAAGYERTRSVWVPVVTIAFLEWALRVASWAVTA